MADLLGIDLPNNRHYETAAGFLIDRLERIPETGEKIIFDNWCFEVVDLDHRRVDKVLAFRLP